MRPEAGRALGLVALALLGAGCAPSGGGDVLLISIDTLRADRLGLYGQTRPTTPEIDRFFADAACYERAYATAASTSPSVVSMLSGLVPQQHGVRLLYQVLAPQIPTLPDLLPKRYQTAAFVSNLVLTDEAIGLAARFDHYDDYVDRREPRRAVYERDAARTTDAALRWLAAASDPTRPAFVWVHYIDPHGPYSPPTDWPRRFHSTSPREIDVDRVPAYQREPGITDGNEYVARYDEEVRYVDRQVGRLLEGWARRRDLDATLVILTADHGESMMDHEQWFTHGYHVYEEIVHIPLLVRGPGVVPGRRSTPVSIVDVAPTVLRFAGAEVPPQLPAVDLRDGAGLAPDRVVYAEGAGADAQWRAAVQGLRKWVMAVPKRDARLPERRFYDLEVDPGELAPRPWDEGPGAGASLAEQVARDPDPAGVPRHFQRGVALRAPKVAPGLPAETLERLEALGYVDGPAASEPPP